MRPFIASGAYTFAPDGVSPAASYYQGQLDRVVNRVHVRFSLEQGSTDGGRMAFAILHEKQTMATIPSMSAHVVIGADDWSYGVWGGPNNGDTKLQGLGYGKFNPPLAADGTTEHDVELTIVGNTANLMVDGNKLPPITDNRIADPGYSGPHVFFECYSHVGDTDDRIRFAEVQAWSAGDG